MGKIHGEIWQFQLAIGILFVIPLVRNFHNFPIINPFMFLTIKLIKNDQQDICSIQVKYKNYLVLKKGQI